MRPVGNMARAEFEVMRLAQELQGKALDYVMESYFAEEDLSLSTLTYARFMKEYERARTEGFDDLDRQLAAILTPILQQVLSAPPEGEQ